LDAAAALQAKYQRLFLQADQRILRLGIRKIHEWISVRLLVAAGDERVEAERVGIRRRLRLLDEHAEHAAFVEVEGRPGIGGDRGCCLVRTHLLGSSFVPGTRRGMESLELPSGFTSAF